MNNDMLVISYWLVIIYFVDVYSQFNEIREQNPDIKYQLLTIIKTSH